MARADGARARHLARELLVKALYQWQLAGHSVAEITAQFVTLDDWSKCDQQFFRELLSVVVDNVAALDVLIAAYASRGLEQLDAVGRAVLLLGLAELKFRADVPTKVAINEGVDLAKRYGAAESYKFVNAVLDKAARQLRPTAGSASP